MKSTSYMIEITTQKNEKYVWEEKSTCLVACSPQVNLEIFHVSLLKSVLLFLTNQATQFISCGIGCSYFSRNFLLSFLLWHDFKILVKSREGGTFLCLASSAKCSVFHFLDLDKTIGCSRKNPNRVELCFAWNFQG